MSRRPARLIWVSSLSGRFVMRTNSTLPRLSASLMNSLMVRPRRIGQALVQHFVRYGGCRRARTTVVDESAQRCLGQIAMRIAIFCGAIIEFVTRCVEDATGDEYAAIGQCDHRLVRVAEHAPATTDLAPCVATPEPKKPFQLA